MMDKGYLVKVGGEVLTCPIIEPESCETEWSFPKGKEWTLEVSGEHSIEMEYYMNRFGRVYFRKGKTKLMIEGEGVLDMVKKEMGLRYGDSTTMTYS